MFSIEWSWRSQQKTTDSMRSKLSRDTKSSA